MKRRGKRRASGPLTRLWRLVSLAALASIAVIGGVSLWTVFISATRHLNVALVRALEQSLHRAVRIESLDAMQPGLVRLRGLAIANGQTFAEGEILRVPVADVRYRFWDMLRGRVDPVGSIQSVTITRPYALIVRSRTNHFNLQDLFPKRRKPPKPSTFRAVVRVRDGTVRFVDHAVRDLPSPQSNVLTSVNATVDAQAPPLIAAALTANAGPHAGRIRANGTVEPATGGFTFSGVSSSDHLEYWTRYLAEIRGLDVVAGRGQVDLRVWKPAVKAPISAVATVVFDSGMARTIYTRAPIEDAAGRLTFRTGHPLEAEVNITATAAGIPLRAAGSLFIGPNARMALTASAEGVTPSRLRQLVTAPIPDWVQPLAPASLQAQIYGSPANPVIVGAVQLPALKLYGPIISNVRAAVRIQDDVVYIPSATGVAGGRLISGHGEYHPRTEALRLVAGAPNLSAEMLGLRKLPLSGVVSTQVIVTGTSSAPKSSVLLTVNDGRFRGIPFQRLTARVNVSGRTVKVERAVADLPGARVTANGEVALDGPVNLRVKTAGAQLGRLLPAAGIMGISGTGFFDGRVVGTLDAPRVQGRASVFNANIRGNRVDYAAGPVRASERGVHLDGMTVARYPAQGVVSGFASFRPNGQVALKMVAKLQTGRLESLLKDAGVEPMAEGNVRTSDNVAIGGTLASPSVSGRVEITDASVQGYPVRQASAAFQYTAGALEVSDLEAISVGGRGGGATVLTVPLVRLRQDRFETPRPFTLTSLHLNHFPGLGAPYADIGGAVDITEGYISGTSRHPSISALVTAPDLAVNGAEFKDVSVRVSYKDTAVAVSDGTISYDGRTLVTIPHAVWNPSTRVGSADIHLDALPAGLVLTLLRKSEWLYNTDQGRRLNQSLQQMDRMNVDWSGAALTLAETAQHGAVAGPLHIFVAGDSLTVDGAAQVTGLKMEDQTLQRASLSGKATNLHLKGGRLMGTISVPPDGFQVDSGDMAVSGQFDGTVGGSLDARLDALNVPLTYAKLFLPRKYKSPSYEMHGAVTATLAAHGDWDKPEMTASVSGKDITIGRRDIPFAIRTTAIQLTNTPQGAVLSARGIRLLARDHSIRFEGEAPFDWKTRTIPADRPLNVTASVDEQGLDLLAVLFGASKGGPIQTAKGSVAAEVRLTGTIADPVWNGYARVADGTVKLRMLDTTFQNITADLSLEPARQMLVVNTLSVQSSSGNGKLVVQPGGTVALPSLDSGLASIVPDLAVSLDNFRIEETPNGLGLGERVRGTLNTPKETPLRVVNGARGPLIKGTILLTDVDVLPPNITPPAIAAGPEPSFVPSFDVTLAVGKNVWVRNPLLRVKLDDSAPLSQRTLRVTNTLTQPRVDGRLTSHEGTFIYPTARFKLTDADIRVHYPAVQDVFGGGGVEGASSFTLSADAQARLMATVNSRRQPVTLYLHVEGPTTAGQADVENGGMFNSLAPYHITLRSSPSLPERQLVALITREDALQQLAQGGNTQDILRQETMNILQASVLPEALSGLESRIGRAFGLESLSLDYTMETSAVSVTAAKRLTDRLVLTYSRPVGDSTEGSVYTVGLSYQLGPRLQLTLQQRKGPLLPSAHSAAMPSTEANVTDTQVLIEGSYPF